MSRSTYTRLVIEACDGGRVDIVKYLEEEVRSIPYLDEFVQHFAVDEYHREVVQYLVEVMDARGNNAQI